MKECQNTKIVRNYVTPKRVPKYQNCPQLTPEGVLQKTKTSKVNHTKKCHKFP